KQGLQGRCWGAISSQGRRKHPGQIRPYRSFLVYSLQISVACARLASIPSEPAAGSHSCALRADRGTDRPRNPGKTTAGLLRLGNRTIAPIVRQCEANGPAWVQNLQKNLQ